MYNKVKALVATCLFGLASLAHAGVMPSTGGYEVSYGINMTPGSSNGSDITNAVVFEWNATSFSAYSAGTIAGRGTTFISHEIGFAPTSALILGYGAGVAGIGDEKDHLYTISSSTFAAGVSGLKWSEAFPGITPETRVGHNAMIGLLVDGNLDAIADFVRTEGYVAAFNPAGSFIVMEWTFGEPVGDSVPTPATLALLGIGLAGLGVVKRRKAQ